MTDPDLRLKALFEADAPPARDHAFTLALLHRMERRRLMADTLVNTAMASIVGGLMYAAWPMLGDWLSGLEPFAQAAALPVGVAVTALISLAVMERVFTGARADT